MSLTFSYRITIGDFQIFNFNTIVIRSTWRTLTDTCEIELAGLNKSLESEFKKGDAVSIEMGYNGQLVQEFTGFVAQVAPGNKFTLMCEDASYLLKKEEADFSAKSITLKEVVTTLVPTADVTELPSVTLAPFIIEKATKWQALTKITKEYGLAIYYRHGQLIAGLPYVDKAVEDKIVNYEFYVNIIDTENLEFRNGDDIRIKCRAVSMLPDNTKITVEVGDYDGDLRTLHFFNITSVVELTARANREIDKFKFSGYSGKLKTFGAPFIEHTYRCNIFDEKHPERATRVFIDEVTTTVTKSKGFKRDVSLGRSAS